MLTSYKREIIHLNIAQILKFLIPSSIGVILFLFPVTYEGNTTIFLAVITSIIRAPFEDYILEIIVSVVVLSAIASGFYQIFKPDWEQRFKSLSIICNTSFPWFLIRLLGASFAVMVYFRVGPEFIWGQETGFTVFTEIGATIFFIVTVACFLMPFLTQLALWNLLER